MTFLEGLALAVGLYLALLARSAWKQGELPQFLRSLTIVAALLAAIALVTAAFLMLEGG